MGGLETAVTWYGSHAAVHEVVRNAGEIVCSI